MAEGDTSKDQERLAKLWDAYEVQEKELELSIKKISTMETKIEELDRVNSVLKKAVEDRDKEIRDLELKIIAMEEESSKFQPQLDEISRLYKEEKERYSKLFTITEELEEDLARMKKENEIKDKWFERNVGMLENLRESIVDRNVKLTEMEKESPPVGDHILPKGEVAMLGPAKTIQKGEGAEVDPTTETRTASESVGTEIRTEIKEATKDEKDEMITFSTVKLEKEEEKAPIEEAQTPIGEPEPPTTRTVIPLTTESDEALKNETIYEFTKIPDIDPLIAESLYDAGYTNINKLKATSTEDLAQIEGISPTMARKIRTNLFEME